MSFNEVFGISSAKPVHDLKKVYFLITARKPRLVTPVGHSESWYLPNPSQLKEFAIHFVPPSLYFFLGTSPQTVFKTLS